MFKILTSFMEEHSLDWGKCVGVCTDGAPAMAGVQGGLQALVRKKAPRALWTHCIIHREAIVAKNVSPNLNDVITVVIKAVNYIISRSHKARFFQKLCEDMGAEHTTLLYFCNARWLSCGNVLNRVFELRNEIHSFLTAEEHVSASKVNSKITTSS